MSILDEFDVDERIEQSFKEIWTELVSNEQVKSDTEKELKKFQKEIVSVLFPQVEKFALGIYRIGYLNGERDGMEFAIASEP